MSTAITTINKNSESSLPKQPFRESLIIPFWSLTVMLVVMNTTMFNVALPNVSKEFALTSTTSAWIITSYSIIFAIATITYSRLSDFIPIRQLLTIGLTLLGIASIIGFIADTFIMLLFARTLQASGAAAVPGLAMILITRYIPVSRRGKAMSMISSAASLGFGLGPVIGGAVTQYLGWNFLFIVTGFVLAFIPLFHKVLPIEDKKKIYFDILGGMLTAAGVTGFLLFLTSYSFVLLMVGIGALALLSVRIRKHNNPFIEPKLFQNQGYLLLNTIGFSAYMIHFATLFIMPLLLVQIFEKSSAEVGLLIFPGAILSAIASRFIGKIIDQFGNTSLIRFGQILLLIAAFLFAFFSTLSPVAILLTYMFMSVGFTSLTSSVSNEISRILSKNEVGTGMGFAQLVQFIGGACGVAVTGVAIVWQKKLPLTSMFQNIFIGMIVLIGLSFILFTLYKKITKPTQ
ncbi:MFS transporter [Priestia megaterium]|nr:MFS transporter [Priestia megaterium]